MLAVSDWFLALRNPFRLFILTVFILISLFRTASPVAAETTNPTCAQTITQWRQVAPLPNDTTLGIPRHHIEGGSAVINGKLYLFTGFADFPETRPWIDVYDPVTNTWETPGTRADMPFRASHITAVDDGNFAWMAGGYLGAHPSFAPGQQLWRYDTVTDTWATSPLWNLPVPRASNGLVRSGRNLHFLGGLNAGRNATFNTHWVLNLDNPDAGWVAAPVLPTARNHLNGVAIDGWVYAVGGQFNHDTDPVDVAIVEAFNTATQQWQTRASLPFPRSHFEPGTLALNDRLIIVGGRDNQNNRPTMVNVTEYNPQTNSWRELLPLPVPLIGPTAKAFGSFIVVTAGGVAFDQGQSNTWIGDVSTDCLIVGAPTPQPSGLPAFNDLRISKSGALEPGSGGLAGDTITWTIVVTNLGNVNEEVALTDQIDPRLTITAASASLGTVTINGQTITVNYFPLPPNDSLTVTITSALRERLETGIISNLAVLRSGRSAQADVRLLPPVTQLPATGESPALRSALLRIAAIMASAVVLLGVLSMRVQSRARRLSNRSR